MSGGRPSSFRDFPALLFPVRAARPDMFSVKGIYTSEGYLYVGIIPFLLSLAGIFFSRGRFRNFPDNVSFCGISHARLAF